MYYHFAFTYLYLTELSSKVLTFNLQQNQILQSTSEQLQMESHRLQNSVYQTRK